MIEKFIFKIGAFYGVIKTIKHAIILSVAAALCFSVMALLVKLVIGYATESMTVFVRFSVGLVWVMSVLGYKRWRGIRYPLKTKHLGLHIVRAIGVFIGIFSFYTALRYVPLVNANLLIMTYALFVPILSLSFFGEKTGVKSWLALGVGFVGIIFILQPSYSDFNPMMLFGLMACFALAVSYLGVHELAKDDGVYTIMIYCFPLTFVFSGIYSIFHWRTPNLFTTLTLIAIGIIGTVYQELLTRALANHSPKIVSPLLYLSVVFSGFLDWLVWGHVPSLFFLIGMVLVLSGCIFSIAYAKDSFLSKV
jgi:drug/metabolite transporter (DMT)-like permease